MPLDKSIRERLRVVLGDHKQIWFAELTGEPQPNISRYMRDRIPPLDFVAKLAKALNLNLNWLILGDGPQFAGEIDLANVSFERIQQEAADRFKRLYVSVVQVKETVEALGIQGDKQKG